MCLWGSVAKRGRAPRAQSFILGAGVVCIGFDGDAVVCLEVRVAAGWIVPGRVADGGFNFLEDYVTV